MQWGELPENLAQAAWPHIWKPGASDLKHYSIFSIFHSHYTSATNGLAIYWRHFIFFVCKWRGFYGILFRSYLFINSSQTFWTVFQGLFLVCISSWTTAVPFLLPALKVCTSPISDVLNRSSWHQSPTLRQIYPCVPARTASCPCCHMSRQLCQSEARLVTFG